MPDIVSARCFGCGHTIRVPAALGGKKARCPQCTNTITIPAPSETQDDIISDDQLTEVARDTDPIAEEGDAPEIVQGELVEEEDPSAVRRRAGTGVRRGVSSPNLRSVPARNEGRGTAPRYAAPPKKSSTGLVIGVVVAVVVAGIAAAAMLGGGGAAGRSKTRAGGGETGQVVQATPGIDEALQVRCLDFIEAVNKGDPAKVVRFFAPEEESGALRDVNRFLEQKPSYANYEVLKADAATGVATFKHSGGEKSFTFKKVGDQWYVADKLSP
jgi:hypothetical protein